MATRTTTSSSSSETTYSKQLVVLDQRAHARKGAREISDVGHDRLWMWIERQGV